MHLPDAVLIGPMKSGTSWIQDYLQARGDVNLPGGVKETFFFDRRFDKGVEWYAAHFRKMKPGRHRLTVEVAPSYFHSADAPERMRSVLGDITLIVTLRDPVRRAWSHYLHLRRYGYTAAPLRKAVEDFPEILEASRYKTCLARWGEFFPKDRLYILQQEDLTRSVGEYAKRLCNGLSIPFMPPPESLQGKRNEAAVPRSFLLAAVGDRTAHFLRAKRLYGVVNFAKRLGLKEFFFGKPGTAAATPLEDADAQWLAEELKGETVEDFVRPGQPK